MAERTEKQRAAQQAWYQRNKEKVAERSRQWIEDNPERVRAYREAWYEKNKEQILARTRERYENRDRDAWREYQRDWNARNKDRMNGYKKKYKYGLTPAEIEQMKSDQGGGCAICGDQESVLGVDHCHATGRVRGLLCQGCNLGLGGMRDNVSRLRSAIAYLERQGDGADRSDSG